MTQYKVNGPGNETTILADFFSVDERGVAAFYTVTSKFTQKPVAVFAPGHWYSIQEVSNGTD